MIEMFLGIAGMMLVVAAFCGGFVFAKHTERKEIRVVADDVTLSEEEIEAKKRELIESEKAFKEQMSYGIEMAYRIPPQSRDGELI